MRAAITIAAVGLTHSLASRPMLAQVPNPNPDLLRASWVNLNRVVMALESYFADFSRYPQSIVELLIIGQRRYMAELPADPCTGAPFGGLTGYTYIPLGNPATSYALRTNWSQMGYGAECYVANNYGNITYSPGRGVQLTP